MTDAEIFITGATGFIGRHLVKHAAQSSYKVTAMGRSVERLSKCFGHTSNIVFANYETDNDGRFSIPHAVGNGVLVHLAGLAHSTHLPKQEYEAAIVDFSCAIFDAASRSKISRAVNVSSIAARDHQQEKRLSIQFYGQAKEKVEVELTARSKTHGLSAISLRPPAVWGHDAAGAAGKLGEIVDRGIPLPVANLTAKRSYIHVDQLCSIILECCEKLLAEKNNGHRVFEVGNYPQTLATLVKSIAAEKGKPARLFPFSQTVLRTALAVGRSDLESQLYSNLHIDDAPLRHYLNTTEADPPI